MFFYSNSIERIFRQLPSGKYQEFYLWFLNKYLKDQTNNLYIISTDLEKIVVGNLYIKGNLNDKALFGNEVLYRFPFEKEHVKLIPMINLKELNYCNTLKNQQRFFN